MNTFLSWQTGVCRDKTCLLSWQKVCLCLSQQNIFVATNTWQKHSFLATKNVFCCDKHVCRNHVFVATKHLSQQKLYLWQLPPIIQGSNLSADSAVTTAAGASATHITLNCWGPSMEVPRPSVNSLISHTLGALHVIKTLPWRHSVPGKCTPVKHLQWQVVL